MRILGILAALLVCGPGHAAGMAQKARRVELSGIDVIVYPTEIKDVVTIVGSLPAGNAFAAPSNVAIPKLTGMMLDRGTVRQDKFAISARLEDAGARLGFGVGDQTVDLQGQCLAADLPLVVSLLAEQLRTPAFQPAEFEKARAEFIGALRNQIDDVGFRAGDAFNRAIYPADHPNRQPTLEAYIAAAENATVDEARAFHRAHYGPANLTLVFVGDVDAAAVQREVSRAFAGWQGGVDFLRAARAPAMDAPREELVALAQKPSVSVVLGQPTGLQYRDPDALALRVGTAILGSGFTGRLMSTVRDREGLTYGIGAGISKDTFTDGGWAISATFAPELLAQGIASTRRELARWWQDGVTAQELADRKDNLIGTYQVGLSNTGGIASAILLTVQRGHDLAWLDELPQAIRALTVAQVNAAMRKYLDPGRMVLVEAGTFEAK